MKYTVQRVVTDHGYGPGWVVLNPGGTVAGWFATWAAAIRACSMWMEISGRP